MSEAMAIPAVASAVSALGLGLCAALSPGATASNTAYLSQNVNVNITDSCSAQNVQKSKNNTYNIEGIDCDDTSLGNQTMSAFVNCNNSQQSNVAAKAAVMQDAKAVANAMGIGKASSSNSSDIQQGIQQQMSATCSGLYNQGVTDNVYNIGKITGKTCEIQDQMMNTQFTCQNTTASNISLTASVTQKAEAKQRSGLGIMIMMFLMAALMIFGPEMAMTALIPKPGKHVPDTLVPDLEARVGELKGQVAAAEGMLKVRASKTA